MHEERIKVNSVDYTELLFHWNRYLAVEKFVEGGITLDIASGSGYGSNLLSKSARRVYGIDVDESSVLMARKEFQKGNLRFDVADGTSLPFDDKYFDSEVSFETIEHMDADAQDKFLDELKRVLKDGGISFISTPDKHRTEIMNTKNEFHIHELYKEEFVELLKKKFKYVDLYLQEVNIASLIWKENCTPKDLMLKKVSLGKNEQINTKDNLMNLHLNMIAVCSDNKIDKIDLSSACVDQARLPYENIWSKLGNLNTDSLDRLDSENKSLKTSIKDLKDENLSLKKRLDLIVTRVNELESGIDNFPLDKDAEESKYTELLKEYQEISSRRSIRISNKLSAILGKGIPGRAVRKILRSVIK